MRNLALIIIAVLLIGCASSSRPSSSQLVRIASIKGHAAKAEVPAVMDRTHIPCIISGEEYESDILAPANRKAEVVEILKQDAQVHKYDITFY
jgi:hypothetical protein